MTDHDPSDPECSCTLPVAHVQNPYTDPVREEAYRLIVMDLFKMGTLSSRIDPSVTAIHCAATLTALVDYRDPVPTMRAVGWEIARLTAIMASGREPQFRVNDMRQCNDPNHNHEMDEDDDNGQFGVVAMEAFFSASSRADLESAVRVLDGVNAEIVAKTEPGERPPLWAGSAGFFANVMISLSVTAGRTIPDPLYYYTP